MDDYELLSILVSNVTDVHTACSLYEALYGIKGYKELSASLKEFCRKQNIVSLRDDDHVYPFSRPEIEFATFEDGKEIYIYEIDFDKTETMICELQRMQRETYIELIAKTWSMCLSPEAKLSIKYPVKGPSIYKLTLPSQNSRSCRMAIPIASMKDIEVDHIGEFATLDHKFIIFHG